MEIEVYLPVQIIKFARPPEHFYDFIEILVSQLVLVQIFDIRRRPQNLFEINTRIGVM